MRGGEAHLLEFVGRDGDGLVDILEGIFDDDTIAGLAEENADGLAFDLLIADLLVYRRHVKAELTDILRLELARLDLNDEVAMDAHVVEEQVESKRISADIKRALLSRIGKARAEVEHEAGYLLDERLPNLVLARLLFKPKEGKVVGIANRTDGCLRIRNLGLWGLGSMGSDPTARKC